MFCAPCLQLNAASGFVVVSRSLFGVTGLVANHSLLKQDRVASVQVEQVRHKPVYKPIRGGGRPPIIRYHNVGLPQPEPYKFNWIPYLPKVCVSGVNVDA